MDAEITKLIQEKLPSIKAKAFADFVAQAEETAKKLEVAEKSVEYFRKLWLDIEAEHRKCKTLDEREKSVTTREKVVAEAEQKQAILNCKLECERDKVSHTLRMFETVFRNVQIRRQTLGSVPVAQSSNGYVSSQSINKEETISEE